MTVQAVQVGLNIAYNIQLIMTNDIAQAFSFNTAWHALLV